MSDTYSSTLDLNVAPDTAQNAFSIPSILTNRFFVLVGNWGVRISFTDQLGDTDAKIIPRASVVMSLQDGLALRDLLNTMLEETEKTLSSKK